MFKRANVKWTALLKDALRYHVELQLLVEDADDSLAQALVNVFSSINANVPEYVRTLRLRVTEIFASSGTYADLRMALVVAATTNKELLALKSSLNEKMRMIVQKTVFDDCDI